MSAARRALVIGGSMSGLLAGLAELDAIEARIADIGVHPDLAGYQDLAHAFDLKSAATRGR